MRYAPGDYLGRPSDKGHAFQLGPCLGCIDRAMKYNELSQKLNDWLLPRQVGYMPSALG